MALVIAFRYPLNTALTVGASLSQIGEFSFILAGLGVSLGLLTVQGQSLIVAAAILAWDLVLAGWIATQRRAPRSFLTLTGVCGLLVAPALAIAVASGTEDGARTVSGIAWLFPLVCAACAVQLLYAMAARLVSPVVALPMLLYDLVVAMVATGDFLVAQFGQAPIALQAAVAARDVVIGITVGRAALITPYLLLVPMIAPTYGARWRLSATVRATMTLVARRTRACRAPTQARVRIAS